jgi:hypothetical protein
MLASTRLARPIVALALAACLAAAAQAALVTATLPDFNGPEHEIGFPVDLGVVGSFSFVLPADAVITSALFSGVYGTALPVYTTAGYDVEIEGETIVVCAPLDPGCVEFDGPVFRPFSLALDASTFDGLLDGLADLRVIQTDAFNVRMGSPTLSIEYQRVPSPGTAWLAGLALALAGWTLQRGRARSPARPPKRRPRPGAGRVAAAARPGSGSGRVAGPALSAPGTTSVGRALHGLVFAGIAGLSVAGPASAAPILFGADADTYLRDATPRGSFEFMDVRGGDVDFRGYLRFDLSSLTEPIQSASLTLTKTDGASRDDAIVNERFALYGLTTALGNTAQNWAEATLVPSTTGTEDVTTLTGVVDLDDNVAGISEVFDPNPGLDSGSTITISGAPLVAFLQSRVNDGGLATFILSNDDIVDRGYGLASKENATAAYRPVLSISLLDATPVPEPATLWLAALGVTLACARRRSVMRTAAANLIAALR